MRSGWCAWCLLNVERYCVEEDGRSRPRVIVPGDRDEKTTEGEQGTQPNKTNGRRWGDAHTCTCSLYFGRVGNPDDAEGADEDGGCATCDDALKRMTPPLSSPPLPDTDVYVSDESRVLIKVKNIIIFEFSFFLRSPHQPAERAWYTAPLRNPIDQHLPRERV